MDNDLFLPRVLAAALSDIAFAGAVGLSLVSFLVQPREGKSNTNRPMLVCAATMLVAVLAQIYLTTATMIATAAPSEVLAQLHSVALETHAGRSLIANAFFTLLLLTVSVIPRHRWSIASTLILLAAARATIGHASSDGDFTVAELVQFTHLLSITIWSGLILAASFIVLPLLESDDIASFMRKLSTTVTMALAFILASGFYNSYRGLAGTVPPLLHTQWGILLCVKILLVAAAIALGFLNRRILHRNPRLTQPQTAQLTRQLRAEAILMLAILPISAALANSPPAA
jgi:putative copper resistance protein D